MPDRRDLLDDAQEVGAWLTRNRDRFHPLDIRRVEPAVIADEDGRAVIELTVILEDPADPDEGWPVDAALALYRAAQNHAAESDPDVSTYVHLQARSSSEGDVPPVRALDHQHGCPTADKPVQRRRERRLPEASTGTAPRRHPWQAFTTLVLLQTSLKAR